MSTKEQEMEALQKIKEILSGIDPNVCCYCIGRMPGNRRG